MSYSQYYLQMENQAHNLGTRVVGDGGRCHYSYVISQDLTPLVMHQAGSLYRKMVN